MNIVSGPRRKVLITGANGFIGKSLTMELMASGFEVAAGVRQFSSELPSDAIQYELGEISSTTSWSQSLQDVDVVIHLAARAHILKDNVSEPLIEFRKVNVDGTLNLAKQAAEKSVKQLIFISSIGVNGNNNTRPFTELDMLNPKEAYAVSKWEAELELLALSNETTMKMVIIRPPLVYGPHAPGNFGSLVRSMAKGIPLPFGAINNRRSFVALDNLVSFIIHCINHPKAANEVFLISDNEDVSTSTLLRKVAKAFGLKSRLIPVPVRLMTFLAKLIGKGDVANRLFGSLQVDSSKARDLLGWKPVITMDEQLKKTADAYLKNEKTL